MEIEVQEGRRAIEDLEQFRIEMDEMLVISFTSHLRISLDDS